MTKELSSLERHLAVSFNNKDVLRQAVVHRSYLNEHPEFPLGNNERLEFLGDAVLELVVTENLYNNYDNREGEITNWGAALVNSQMLSRIANDLHLEDFIYLSKGEAKDQSTKARQFILANALEAIIGAVYLDQGWEAAKMLIQNKILIHLPEILEKKLYIDPKSHLQEIAQERFGFTPFYKVLEESGPDHAKQFVVAVYLGDEQLATGLGTSKQEAQVEAAARALEAKGW